METWRLLETWEGGPGFNMALDEALLLRGGSRPALRFYTWSPDTLSLGYFQRHAELPLERAGAVVRRMTGGGAIHHARELTFSIAAPLDHPLYRGEVRASYERVHGALARALSELGLDAAPRGTRTLASDVERSGMCFQHSTDVDLVWGARKGVGSAQRRSAGRVLHHGSIKLERSELEPGVAAVGDVAPELGAIELAALLADRMSREFHARLELDEPADLELEHAEGRTAHFTSDAFVRRR